MSNVVPIRPREASRAVAKPIGRGCEICATPLFARSKRDYERKRFCSWECAGNASKVGERRKNAKPTLRSCQRCSSEYMGMPVTKYCSVRCCNAAGMARLAKRRESVEYHLSKLAARSGRSDLTKEFLADLFHTQAGRCAITGVQMTWRSGEGHLATNISIDRIAAKGPYEPGNVRLVCHVVNLMRRDMPDEVFAEWCLRVVAGFAGAAREVA